MAARKRVLHPATALLPLAIGLGANVAMPNKTPATNTAAEATVFTPACTLPFKGAAIPAIDGKCGMQGGSSDPAKQAESASKNNFCVTTNSPQAVTHQDLVDMQTKSTAANLPKSLPDRKPLTDMGEGKYVSYVAFVKDAHYSDVAAGEAVNCNIPGNDTNDIHIVLMADPTDQDECHSTTAEMSPHFRPASWTPENIMKASAGHPIRVMGHLFYDGSHVPCSGTSRPNPKRISLWEVHPVYSFDVCTQTTLAECQSSTAEWTPLSQVFASEPSEQ